MKAPDPCVLSDGTRVASCVEDRMTGVRNIVLHEPHVGFFGERDAAFKAWIFDAVRWRDAPERDEDLLLCPCCGAAATLHLEHVVHGRGTWIESWMVSCVCGMRTRPVPGCSDVSADGLAAKRGAISIWNERPERKVRSVPL